MNDAQVRELVLNIIQDIAPDEDISDVKPDVRLRDQLDLDSMDFLDIIMELRKRYKIEVPEEDYMQLSTLNGCVAYLKPMLEAQGVKAKA
jgi:acyl carrier protein